MNNKNAKLKSYSLFYLLEISTYELIDEYMYIPNPNLIRRIHQAISHINYLINRNQKLSYGNNGAERYKLKIISFIFRLRDEFMVSLLVSKHISVFQCEKWRAQMLKIRTIIYFKLL